MISRRIRYTIQLSSFLAAFASCHQANQPANTQQDSIKVYPAIRLQPQKTIVSVDYPATIQGIENVEIRPKIDGYVDDIFIDEGVYVRKDQPLFRINAPQYEEALKTAEANIKIAVADVDAARMQVEKIKPLVDQDIVSPYQLKNAQYTLESKQAALAQAKASLSNAKTNLGYTLVRSPANGMVGVLPYKIGSLVNSTTAQPLTTVSNITRIFAYFSINEREGLDFFQSAKGNSVEEKLAGFPDVHLVLANGTLLPSPGKIQAASGLINPQTGAFNLRATFDNANGLVRSGSSAIVRMPKTIDTALLIPQKATYQLQGKLFAYVIDTAGKAKAVELTVAAASGLSYVVRKGLRQGDLVIIDGIATLKEDQRVKPSIVSENIHSGN